jgi:hypothetical protein
MNPSIKAKTFLSIALILLFIGQTNSHAGDTIIEPTNQMPEELPITISVQNEPLGQVLNKIGDETGMTFSVDVQWKTYPVSVTLYKTPLHKGLKRILANLNNVIIYESGNKVKIIILGKIEPSKKGPKYQPTPVYRQPGPAPEAEPEPDETDEPPNTEAKTDKEEKEEEEEEEEPAVDSDEPDEKEPAEKVDSGNAEQEDAESKKAEDKPSE